MEYPTPQEDKLELVTRFIRDIRRVARKLGEGGAPFPELQELYEVAEVFQKVRRAVPRGDENLCSSPSPLRTSPSSPLPIGLR